MMNPLWKTGCIALAILLIASATMNVFSQFKIVGLERDVATEQSNVSKLQSGLTTCNASITAMGKKEEESKRITELALAAAAKANSRYEAALNKTKNINPETCNQAIPVLNENVFGGAK
jgi:hypothetical protein